MDIKYLYLLQFVLWVLIYLGIRWIRAGRRAKVCGLFKSISKVSCSPIYSGFAKHIEKKYIQAFDKYQMWRYVEHREVFSFI